ncbi:lipoprotein-releasing system ATP-binding protein LolD, partial [Klebsiella grimontii]|nr:lipoprotein-releasing system ATP-binding protein LolD [Klebsiella grimontii]
MRTNINELPDISLRGIYKNYGMGENEVVALKNINIDIAAGEFMA